MTPPQQCPPTIPASRLPAGTLCVKCGYLLDGLTLKDLCPECGSPIEYIQPCELVESLGEVTCRAISRAATIILWGLALALIVAPAMLIAGRMISSLIGMPVRLFDVDLSFSDIAAVLTLVFFIVGSLTTATGQTLSMILSLPATTRDSIQQDRNAAIVLIFLRELSFILLIAPMFFADLVVLSRGYSSCNIVLFTALTLASHICFCHTWGCIAHLAGNPTLERSVRIAKRGIVVGTLVMLFARGAGIFLTLCSLAMIAVSLRRAANTPRPAHASTL